VTGKREILKCPLLSVGTELLQPCLLEKCAWFNRIKGICAIADIADRLKSLTQVIYESKVVKSG